MQGLRSLINNILTADKLGKQTEACRKLEDGVKEYVKHEVVWELEQLASRHNAMGYPTGILIDRISTIRES
jgi:hypothetical protein|tara:strand:- start:4909 stop:5121 length:213 start_codon:yes stop_codon:yes gene_type:complete